MISCADCRTFVYRLRMRIAIVVLALAVSPLLQPAPSPSVLSVLASGAVEGSIVALQGTVPATLRFETSQGISARLAAGDTPDVLIAQSALVDQLIEDGKALADSRAPIGRMPIGVAVSRGARHPDISSASALKAAILNANAVVISQGASGAYLEAQFRAMGISDAIQSKLRREARGDDVMKRIGESGGNTIGFTMVSEIKYGERHGGAYVGPLPAAMQNYTAYDAVVMRASRSLEAAHAFVRALRDPAARRVLAANGWEF